MRKCELCGADTPDNLSACQRCGFEFPLEIRSDIRNIELLKKHKGKEAAALKKDLRERLNQLSGYIANLDLKNLKSDEINSLIEEGLTFLHIPMAIGIGDELTFSNDEREFILLMAEKVDMADVRYGSPVASSGSYVRLTNALHCLEQMPAAMAMIDKALLIDPNSADALFGKAKLLFFEKRYEKANRYLTKLTSKKEHQKALYLAELIGQLVND